MWHPILPFQCQFLLLSWSFLSLEIFHYCCRIGLKLFSLVKIAHRWERGEGRGVQISKQRTQNLSPKDYLEPCTGWLSTSETIICWKFILYRALRSLVHVGLATVFTGSCCRNIQGLRYFLGQRFCVLCWVLQSLPLSSVVQISKLNRHRTFNPINTSTPVLNETSYFDVNKS